MLKWKLWKVLLILVCFVISTSLVNFGFISNISLRAGLKWIPNSIQFSTITCNTTHLKSRKASTMSATIETCKSSTFTKVIDVTNQNCELEWILKHSLEAFTALNSRLAELHLAKDTTVNETIFLKDEKTKIGVLIPTTTRNLKCNHLLNLSLFETCLPSILNTLNRGFSYKIYIGFDSSDMYFSKMKNKTKFDSLYISLVRVPCQTFVAAVNTIAKVAYEEGMDYLVRINDDTEFISLNWTALAIDVLRNYNPPNVGVVGPTCNEGNPSILTHDMIHRTHLELFNYYYPPAFKNWWADDWITQIYQPDRFTKLPTWAVKHLLQDTRYSIDMSIQNHLLREVNDGKIKVHCYASMFKKDINKTQIQDSV